MNPNARRELEFELETRHSFEYPLPLCPADPDASARRFHPFRHYLAWQLRSVEKREKREREGGEEREREKGRERRIARGESSSAPRNFTAGYLCRAETRDRFQARMAERRIVWNSRFRKMEILGIPRYVSHGFRETATAVEFICTIICRLRSYSPCGGSATWMRASIYITVEIMINSIVCDEQCIRDVKGERSDSFLRRLHDQKTKGSKGGELVGGWTCLAVH